MCVYWGGGGGERVSECVCVCGKHPVRKMYTYSHISYCFVVFCLFRLLHTPEILMCSCKVYVGLFVFLFNFLFLCLFFFLSYFCTLPSLPEEENEV